MKAIFDKECKLVGWYEEKNGLIFDVEMQWIGFVTKGYLFTTMLRWLGGMEKGTIVDKNGKPIAWVEGVEPQATERLIRPYTPLRPLNPIKPLKPILPIQPLKPVTPVGGWSNKSWITFFSEF